jgi:small-conductance mechanosensitive channel
MKTIKQIADEIGVSKQAVQQKLKKEPLASSCRQHTTTNGNTIYIKNQGVELIKSAFSASVAENLSATTDNEIVDFLKEQLKEKDRQIAEKDKQLSDITAALVAAQQTAATAQALHAGTLQQQLATSEVAPDPPPSDELEAETSAPTEPPVEPIQESAEFTALRNQVEELQAQLAQKSEKRGFFGLFSRKS